MSKIVSIETTGSIRHHLERQMVRAIHNFESGLVEQLLFTSAKDFRHHLENFLLTADLGELTSEEKRHLKLQEKLLVLRRLHATRLADPNYGRGGNNRPILRPKS